jgi:hypothetical protein
MSTAMTLRAPARAAAWMAAFPTPPQPNTATVSSRPTLAVFTIAPNPAMIPQPTRPAASGRAAGSTLTAWPAATRHRSAKAPMPMAAVSGVPSSRVIFWLALRLSKQYQGRPRRQERQRPHGARQARTTKSPGARWSTPGPTASTFPAASWPSRNGNWSLIAPSR